MTYVPKPIETEGVKIPFYLRSLVERLAENNHDLWARKRLAEGWRYGPLRDDNERTHPDLTAYAELPKSEKNYDRVSVIEILKVIMALGYRVLRPERLEADFLYRTVEGGQDLEKISHSELLKIWSAISSGYWGRASKAYVVLGEQLLNSGEPFMAYDLVSKGLERWPNHSRLRQLLGLSLARSGAAESANQIMGELYREGKRDGEILGILARTHKDMAGLSSTVSGRNEQL